MAQFPLDTAHILALAETMITGLRSNPTVFPAPPVSADDLEVQRDAAVAAADEQVAAQAAAKAATERKTAAFAAMSTSMKHDISYAEYTAKTPAELGLIGWGPKAEPEPLAAPGQPLVLEIAHQEADSLELDWKKPRTGGKVAYYRAEMRKMNPTGEWELQGTATTTKIELVNLPPGAALEFRVIAENAAGTGLPSNTVAVVL
jgi:hypothetical protein